MKNIMLVKRDRFPFEERGAPGASSSHHQWFKIGVQNIADHQDQDLFDSLVLNVEHRLFFQLLQLKHNMKALQ